MEGINLAMGGCRILKALGVMIKSSQTYLPVEANGTDEHYGAFKVSFKDTQMIWEREGDGLHVTVRMERATKLPKSTADKFVGLWNLKDFEKKVLPKSH